MLDYSLEIGLLLLTTREWNWLIIMAMLIMYQPLTVIVTIQLLVSIDGSWLSEFFCDVYLRHHPARTAELIQYNHIIQVASLTYQWDNVYRYDREFCLHIAQNPGQSWGIILQQAWSVTLKDRNSTAGYQSGGKGSRNCREICFRFNSGKCTFRDKCKFDHRCGICGKYGHGAHDCRKLNNNFYDKKDRFDMDRPDRDHNDKRRKGDGYHGSRNNGSNGAVVSN